MRTIGPRDSLSFALSEQLARLYAVIIAGWILISMAIAAQNVFHGPLEFLTAYPLLLAGVIALYGGTIALLVNIVAEASAAAVATTPKS